MSQKGNEGEFHYVFSLSSELSALAIILDLLKSLFSIKRHITLQIIKYLLELFKVKHLPNWIHHGCYLFKIPKSPTSKE